MVQEQHARAACWMRDQRPPPTWSWKLQLHNTTRTLAAEYSRAGSHLAGRALDVGFLGLSRALVPDALS